MKRGGGWEGPGTGEAVRELGLEGRVWVVGFRGWGYGVRVFGVGDGNVEELFGGL